MSAKVAAREDPKPGGGGLRPALRHHAPLNMLRFLLRRLALTIPTFVALMFVTFVAIRLVPGDPVEVRVGERGISAERLAMFRHELGLDQPVWMQFADYIRALLHGDFGHSLVTSQPVLTEFAALFPATIELSLCAMLLAALIGVPAGTIAAARRGSVVDQALMGLSVTGYSMPIFWWGLLLIMFVGERWGLTPVSGRIDLIKFYFEPVTGFMTIDAWLSGQRGAVSDALHHLLLPAIVLGTVPLAVIARMTRSAMLEVLSEDYVRTARAKGLSSLRVVGAHALRNALIPVVTVIGLQVGSLLAGAVLTETIFSWPGVGKWLIEAIARRDYPALQGGVMLISSVVIVVNLFVDLTYGLINPRIRHA
jgi:dipeptide transport system permease protein